MTQKMNRETRGLRIITALSLGFLLALIPIASQAKAVKTLTCNALVSQSNDLFLVSPAGKVLTRFTSDGRAKDYAVLAPNGGKVAYVLHSDRRNNSYWVGDANGTQSQFPVYTEKSKLTDDYDALGPLMGLYWSSNDVLRLEKHVSPSDSRFEFHRINSDMTGSARLVTKAAYGDGCTIGGDDRRVACVRGADVTINGKEIFHLSAFGDTSPILSFTLSKGETKTTSSTPSFKVTFIGFYKKSIGIKVLLPNGNGGETYLSGSKDFMPLWWNGQRYDFYAKVIDRASGLVRINVIKGNDVYHKTGFSPVIAWQSHGHGLLLAQRTKRQTFLDLIQPGRGHISGHPLKEQDPQWHLAAQAPVPWSGDVQSMRFLTPTVLLLNTGSYQDSSYSKVRVHIANGRDNGKPTLTVGAVTILPATIAVTRSDNTNQSAVLGWSCQDRN